MKFLLKHKEKGREKDVGLEKENFSYTTSVNDVGFLAYTFRHFSIIPLYYCLTVDSIKHQFKTTATEEDKPHLKVEKHNSYFFIKSAELKLPGSLNKLLTTTRRVLVNKKSGLTLMS